MPELKNEGFHTLMMKRENKSSELEPKHISILIQTEKYYFYKPGLCIKKTHVAQLE